jgi:hypothetical protein
LAVESILFMDPMVYDPQSFGGFSELIKLDLIPYTLSDLALADEEDGYFVAMFATADRILETVPLGGLSSADTPCGCSSFKSANKVFEAKSSEFLVSDLVEPNVVAAQQNSTENVIVVTGVRVPTGTQSGSGGGAGGGTGGTGGQECWTPDGYVSTGGEFMFCPPPEYQTCLNLAALTSAERDKVLIALEAAEIAEEILAQPDEDDHEYGSLIYRDRFGVITHTPIARGTATGAMIDNTGLNVQEFSSIYALVHSHTPFTWSTVAPERALVPTRDASQGDGRGDWAALDGWVYSAAESKISLGMERSVAYAEARAQMSQFVLGANGPRGSGNYLLHHFTWEDRDTSNASDGEQVQREWVVCSGS